MGVCNKCGTQMVEGTDYCVVCGNHEHSDVFSVKDDINEKEIKKLSFKIWLLPILVSLLFFGIIYMNALSDSRNEKKEVEPEPTAETAAGEQYDEWQGVPQEERRETCFYSDTVNWDSDVEGVKAQAKGILLSENEKGIVYKYDGIDGLYQGDIDVFYIMSENVLSGVVTYLPYSPELFNSTVEYYDAEKSNEESDRYMAVAGNNNVNISVENEKITIVFFLK